MSPDIVVQSPDDWNLVRQRNLGVVVDPMVFRTADVFLRGAAGALQSPEMVAPEDKWRAISANVGSLCAFFDTLILEPSLPMYDYDITFPPDIDTGRQVERSF